MPKRLSPLLTLVLVAASLGGCATAPSGFGGGSRPLSERECLARVMYFESNRSSDEGMVAVGTVVMNRVQSPRYPKSVCAVIGQQNQFADGALSQHVSRRSAAWARAERAADSVLAGARHDGVGAAMFFHTAGYTFPYRNMKYVTLAGGNAFYEKQRPGTFTPGMPWEREQKATMLAAASERAKARETAEDRRAAVLLAAVARPAARPAAGTVPTSRLAAALARPRPIVVAMLAEPKGRSAHGVRSIADLIEMDLKQR